MKETFNAIKKQYEVLHWDLEYWNSYIIQYEDNDLQCSEEQRQKDLEECYIKKEMVLQDIQELKENYPEYLI